MRAICCEAGWTDVGTGSLINEGRGVADSTIVAVCALLTVNSRAFCASLIDNNGMGIRAGRHAAITKQEIASITD